MVAPQAAGVSTFVFPFLPLLIQVAITILQQLLGRTS
jgi:hypothetical protein